MSLKIVLSVRRAVGRVSIGLTLLHVRLGIGVPKWFQMQLHHSYKRRMWRPGASQQSTRHTYETVFSVPRTYRYRISRATHLTAARHRNLCVYYIYNLLTVTLKTTFPVLNIICRSARIPAIGPYKVSYPPKLAKFDSRTSFNSLWRLSSPDRLRSVQSGWTFGAAFCRSSTAANSWWSGWSCSCLGFP